MKFRVLILAGALLLISDGVAHAQIPDLPDETLAEPQAEGGVDQDAHPQLSTDSTWAGAMLIVALLGFFVPAAVIGPVVHSLVASEMPELHDHEESDPRHASQHEPGHGRIETLRD